RGDWIETAAVEGTVEEIGVATTKLRTFANSVQTIPNRLLADQPITNWSKMRIRRIKMLIGVEYRTTGAQLEKIVSDILAYLENNPEIAQPKNSKAKLMVHLAEFASSSVNIDLYYFTKTTNWQEWRRIKHENMLEFMKIVEKNGAAFAFPSQSIYVEQLPEEPEKKSVGKKVKENNA
ncbi:MAG: mechanosensitive ion channel, partial [Nitrospinae bacterium]|nr:mechanosensitive ion channel [Nitrospinota bacterium]